MVASLGFEVRLMSSGRECLDTAHIDRAVCLIVDVNMPGIDGFELLTLLESSRRGVPPIIISGFYQDDYQEKARTIGAVALLSKPCDEILLRDAIQKALAAN
jgi:two-component system, LuxR family, response regulator FixJ